MLEDLHDLAVVAERRLEERIALEEIKRRLTYLCRLTDVVHDRRAT